MKDCTNLSGTLQIGHDWRGRNEDFEAASHSWSSLIYSRSMNTLGLPRSEDLKTYAILSCMFAGTIVAANLMGTKVVPFFTVGSYQLTGSVGIFLYPLSFLITDIVTEIYGPKATRSLITGTLIVLLIVLGATALATVLPPAERFAAQDEAYVGVFRSSLRIIIASIVAFVLSQYHDVWAFDFWKKKTNGRFLWLRNNASTIVSQLIDTVIFMLIAFWGMSDRFTLAFVLGSMVPPYYLLKVMAAALDTPLVYLGVRMLRQSQKRNARPVQTPAGATAPPTP
jgi:queuosine precursor transporter